jgi:Importin-beta N-terminal domain
MEAAQHVVEQACVQLQNPGMHRQASGVLLAFRNSPEAVTACKHILEHSSSDMARFQAAITLREAALREWPLMSPSDRVALQSYVLQLVLRCSSVLP